MSAFALWALYSAGMWPFAFCDDSIKAEVVSPNGAYTATVSERNCGATTDYSTMVSLRQSGSALKIDGQGKNTVFVLEGQYPVGLKWHSNNSLWITFPAGGRPATKDVFKKQASWDSVVIQYK